MKSNHSKEKAAVVSWKKYFIKNTGYPVRATGSYYRHTKYRLPQLGHLTEDFKLPKQQKTNLELIGRGKYRLDFQEYAQKIVQKSYDYSSAAF